MPPSGRWAAKQNSVAVSGICRYMQVYVGFELSGTIRKVIGAVTVSKFCSFLLVLLCLQTLPLPCLLWATSLVQQHSVDFAAFCRFCCCLQTPAPPCLLQATSRLQTLQLPVNFVAITRSVYLPVDSSTTLLPGGYLRGLVFKPHDCWYAFRWSVSTPDRPRRLSTAWKFPGFAVFLFHFPCVYVNA